MFRVRLIVLGILAMPSAALAVNPASWSIVQQINRSDTSKTWVSPTAIDLNHDAWLYEFEITKLTATVRVLFDITVDITDQIPPEYLSSTGESSNLPAVLLDESLADETSGTTADVFVEVDNLGFGRAVFDNIMLGNVEVAPFGSLPIRRIDVEANVTITGVDFADGDYNHDDVIDAADYIVWRRTFDNAGPNLPADGNDNGVVDAPDYAVWTQHFGQSGGGSLDLAPVPEPAVALILLTAIPASLILRRRGMK